MKRSGKPLKRTASLKRGGNLKRTPLKKVSKYQKKINERWYEERAVYLNANPKCKVEGCSNDSRDVHHMAGRRGVNMWKHWLPVCRSCHDKIHNNPRWASDMGYMLSHYGINDE